MPGVECHGAWGGGSRDAHAFEAEVGHCSRSGRRCRDARRHRRAVGRHDRVRGDAAAGQEHARAQHRIVLERPAARRRPAAALGQQGLRGQHRHPLPQPGEAAAKLPETGHKSRNAGPFGGIEDVKDVGSGNELFGKVGGIGTAMAVDPNAGNTVYLGTIGGLYKTTEAAAR